MNGPPEPSTETVGTGRTQPSPCSVRPCAGIALPHRPVPAVCSSSTVRGGRKRPPPSADRATRTFPAGASSHATYRSPRGPTARVSPVGKPKEPGTVAGLDQVRPPSSLELTLIGASWRNVAQATYTRPRPGPDLEPSTARAGRSSKRNPVTGSAGLAGTLHGAPGPGRVATKTAAGPRELPQRRSRAKARYSRPLPSMA